MKHCLPVLLFCGLLTSCASLLNQPYRAITVHTDRPAKVTGPLHTLPTVNNAATLAVPRSREPVTIRVESDSGQREVKVRPFNSFGWYANILFNYGLGMLVDRHNPRRYSYPRHVYLAASDTAREYYRYTPLARKGMFLGHLSLPHINSFYLRPRGEKSQANVGFWGLSVGADYYYREGRSVGVRGSAVADFFVPFPAAVDISGEYEMMSSAYVAAAHSHHLGRVVLGYGLCFASNTWDLRYYDRFSPPPPTRDPVKKTSTALGFYFPAHYRLGRHFFGGIIYRPTIVSFAGDSRFGYEHLLSIDFGWKFRLKSSRR